MHAGRSDPQPRSQYPADVAHPSRSMTARERALWTFGEGDDLLDAQDREGVIEAGAPDLSRVTAAPAARRSAQPIYARSVPSKMV